MRGLAGTKSHAGVNSRASALSLVPGSRGPEAAGTNSAASALRLDVSAAARNSGALA